MAEISPEQAIERARQALGVAESVSGVALRVERLDTPGEAYFLVLLFGRTGEHGVAAIDARTGSVSETAELSGNAPQLMVNEKQAIAAARLHGVVSARLVWRPSRASRSLLYPIWECTSAMQRRYVDQQGQVWDNLPSSGWGGGP
jgi:hypothetical protein